MATHSIKKVTISTQRMLAPVMTTNVIILLILLTTTTTLTVVDTFSTPNKPLTTTPLTTTPPQLLPTDEFTQRCTIHKTISSIRYHLPLLLQEPISSSSEAIENTYAIDCLLVGPRNEILGTGRDEILQLAQMLQTATKAVRRGQVAAISIAQRLINNSDKDEDEKSSPNVDDDDDDDDNVIDCQFTLNRSLTAIHCSWSLPTPNNNKLSGASLFSINPSGTIAKHQVLLVRLDGTTIDGIGETLASLRRTVKIVQQQNPWVLETAVPILTDLAALAAGGRVGSRTTGEEEEGVETTTERRRGGFVAPPLFIADIPRDQLTNTTAWETTAATTTDGISSNDSAIPFPGFPAWITYERTHTHLRQFIDVSIPQLSNGRSSCRKLFTSNATMISFDGKTMLMEGGGRLSDLYQSVARLSSSSDSSSTWKPMECNANWRDATVEVYWMTDSQITVEGRDVFHLDDDGLIYLIEQKELLVGGTTVVSDPSWVSSLITAVEGSSGGVVVRDILNRLMMSRSSGGGGGGSIPTKKEQENEMAICPPALSEPAAATVYNLIRSLHSTIPRTLTTSPSSSSSSTLLIPGEPYIAKDIELRGLLDETLARGRDAYRQALSVSIGALRSALRSGSVELKRDVIVPRIEILNMGTIRVEVEIKLGLRAPLSFPPLVSPRQNKKKNQQGRTNKPTNNNNNNNPFLNELMTTPIVLKLVSEYRLDNNGYVMEHKIVENTINDQKSPADVVALWVKGTSDYDDDDDDEGWRLNNNPLLNSIVTFLASRGN